MTEPEKTSRLDRTDPKAPFYIYENLGILLKNFIFVNIIFPAVLFFRFFPERAD